LEKGSRGHFLHASPALLCLPVQSYSRVGMLPFLVPWSPPARTHLSGPSSPKSPLLRARVSSPASSPSLSHPCVDSFLPQCCHLCAHTREPSRRHSCSMESCRRCRLCPTLLLTASPGCRCQPINDEALEQPASLAELPVLKAHRLD
jgi:hypothetical protein